MKHFILLLFTIISFSLLAQGPDFDSININNFSIPFSSVLSHGWKPGTVLPGSLAPKGSGNSPIYTFSLWMGGVDSNRIVRAAANTYRAGGTDYFYGPLKDDGTALTDSIRIQEWNKVYKLERWELNQHVQGIRTSQNILDWPANGESKYGESEIIAPFFDKNKNGIYEPSLGDYPEMLGDEMLFMVNNDVGGKKRQAGGLPLGIEIQTRAYAFSCTDNDALNNTVFVEYTIINKSKINYDSFFYGKWADINLGNPSDDLVGSDLGLHGFIGYNGDSVDEGSYEKRIPAVSFTGLEDKRFGKFLTYNHGNAPNGSPNLQNTRHHYNYLRGRWKNGDPIRYGGNGFSSFTGGAVDFMYPDDPMNLSGWSQRTSGIEPYNVGGNVASFGPDTFLAGDTIVTNWAITFAQSHSGDRFDSYDMVCTYANEVKKQFNMGFKSACTPTIGTDTKHPKSLSTHLYPNPANGFVQIQSLYQIERVSIFNMNGALIREFRNESGTVDVSMLPAGTYLLKVESRDAVEVLKLQID